MCHVQDVYNERIYARPALRLKNGGNGMPVRRVCAQSIDSLCWECDKPAFAQEVGCASYAVLIGRRGVALLCHAASLQGNGATRQGALLFVAVMSMVTVTSRATVSGFSHSPVPTPKAVRRTWAFPTACAPKPEVVSVNGSTVGLEMPLIERMPLATYSLPD